MLGGVLGKQGMDVLLLDATHFEEEGTTLTRKKVNECLKGRDDKVAHYQPLPVTRN
jgi:hypothetical protein